MITRIEKCPSHLKRFRAYMSDGCYYDFGKIGVETFIDKRNTRIREHYYNYHLGKPIDKAIIKYLIVCPTLLEVFLLYGRFDTIEQNALFLNKILSDKNI